MGGHLSAECWGTHWWERDENQQRALVFRLLPQGLRLAQSAWLLGFVPWRSEKKGWGAARAHCLLFFSFSLKVLLISEPSRDVAINIQIVSQVLQLSEEK